MSTLQLYVLKQIVAGDTGADFTDQVVCFSEKVLWYADVYRNGIALGYYYGNFSMEQTKNLCCAP